MNPIRRATATMKTILAVLLVVTLFVMTLTPLVSAADPVVIDKGEPVEVIGLRTEYSETYYMGGGLYRMVTGGDVIHWKYDYADPTEAWKDVDLTWRDGRIDQAPYILEQDGNKYTFTDRKTGKVTTIEVLSSSTSKSIATFQVVPFADGVSFQHLINADQLPFTAQFRIEGDARVVTRAWDDKGDFKLTTDYKDGILTESLSSLTDSMTSTVRAASGVIRIDPTVTVQPATKDALLSLLNPAVNYGSLTALAAARDNAYAPTTYYRSIIHMTMPADPGDSATIYSVKLYLYKYTDVGGYTCPTLEAHTLTQTGWVEAQATWNIYKTGNNWATAGGDYSATIIDMTNDVKAFGSYGWEYWILKGTGSDNPINPTWGDSVHLMMKYADTATKSYTQWYSSDYAVDTSLRPKMIIDYYVLPEVETLPATAVSSTTATIWGNITDDGDDTCEARFRYMEFNTTRADWLTGWSYRKTLNMTGSAGAGTGYQRPLRIYPGVGVDSAGVAYLDNLCDDFPAQVRFTDDDGSTLLDHWYETNVGANNTYRDFWIEVQDDLSSNCVIDIYYNKTGEVSLSDGDATFTFFDDFPGTSLNLTKWTADTAFASVSGGILTYQTGVPAWRTLRGTTVTGNDTFAMRGRGNLDESEAVYGTQSSDGLNAAWAYRSGVSNYIASRNSTAQTASASNFGIDAYALVDLYIRVDINTRAFEGGVERLGSPKTTNPPGSTDMRAAVAAYGTNAMLVDWIFLRKYILSEPVVGTPSEVEDQWDWTYTAWQNSLETGDTFHEHLTGLTAATYYEYQAQARNDAGTTAWTSSEYFTTCPAAPTSVVASDGNYTDLVMINWTQSSGLITGYKVYRDGGLIDTVGDVATHNDTGADPAIITSGAAAASDGSSTAHVTINVSGESVAYGTSHTYKVRAYNDGGDSPDSNTDTGYRGYGAITYQWYRSSGDADADYLILAGATTDPYNDTTAPAPNITAGVTLAADGVSTLSVTLAVLGESVSVGGGRYYECVVNATGAAPQYSTADRGYRGSGNLTYQWYSSADNITYSIIPGGTVDPYDDTTAPAPTITAGNASATDATSATLVTLNLTGEVANNGTAYYFVCVVGSADAVSQNSTEDTGYRGIDTLGYQWQRSAADSDAAYSNIAGGTTVPYDDAGGVHAPDGRYYMCLVSMSGAVSQNSTADRGNTAAVVPPTVTSSNATDILWTSATLWGNITDTGFENPATRGFEWGYSTGNYTLNWTEAGAWGTGVFSYGVSGLPVFTTVFWRALAINSAGAGYSGELNFTTLNATLPSEPTNLAIDVLGTDLDYLGGNSSDTTYCINVTWVPGTYSESVYIRYSTTGYPNTPDEGNLAYNGTGNWTVICGLALDTTTYYISAWGENLFGFSVGYATIDTAGGVTMLESMLLLGLLLGSIGLMIGMFVTKNGMLGFPSSIIWFALAGMCYQKSEVTWDLFYILFFAAAGIGIFAMYSAFTLRKRDLAGPDADKGAFIDEGGRSKGSGRAAKARADDSTAASKNDFFDGDDSFTRHWPTREEKREEREARAKERKDKAWLKSSGL